MDTSLLIPLVISGAVLLLGIVFAADGDAAMTARVKTVAKDRAPTVKRKGDMDLDRRKKMMGNLKELEAREQQKRKERVSMKSRLEQAGLPIDVRMFWIVSVGVGLLAVAAISLFMHQPIYFAALGGAVIGFGLPRWVVGFLVGRRQKKFVAEFANSIDIIVRGVKSGLPLIECLRIIAREAPEPLGSEFRRLCDSISMGVPVEQALRQMFERMPLPEVSFFSIVLSIQLKAGGNLSEALGNLSTVLRSRKLMREKINALSSEAKASAAIIGSLPIIVTVLVYITSPSYILLLFTDPTGHMNLLIGGTMMTIGILIMRKMINFDI
jgi:tight adherence protein B